MKQVAVTDLAAYFDDEITAMPNLVTTGALNSGSIATGFGAINNGSSAITTSGTISFGSLTDGSVTITDIADEDDFSSDSATKLATQQSIKAYVTTVAGQANNVTGLNATGTELNAVADGDTSASSITVEDADRIPINDGGTMKQIAVTTLAAYLDDEITAMPNLTSTGALNSGSITSGFGNIDIGSDNLTATGTISLGATSFNDNNVTNVGSIALDTITNDGTDITLDSSGDIILDAAGNNVTIKSGGTSILDVANNSSDVELTVSVADKNFKIKGTDSSSAITALDIDMAAAGAATFNDKIIATELDISGDADIDGTLEADAITINGTAIGSIYSVIAGSSSIVTTGALDSGSITSGFGNIDVGSSNLTATGTVSLGATSFNDNNITNVGNIALDSLTADGSSITITGNTTFADGSFDFDIASHDTSNGLKLGGTLVTATAAELNYVDGVTSNIQTQLNNAATTGKAIAMAMVFG